MNAYDSVSLYLLDMSTNAITEKQAGIQLREPQNIAISNENLKKYGEMLKFDDKYLRNANEVGNKVMNALKQSPMVPERFSVSETHSCQEGVDDTGIDIVAFVKGDTDLKKAETEYSKVVKDQGGQNVTVDDHNVVHFNLNGIRVNLGISQSKGPTVVEHRKAVFQQVTRMDPQGKLHKNQVEKVSVDLHDSMNEFLKQQQKSDEFTLNAQRLARAWRQTALGETAAEWFSPVDSMLLMQNTINQERARVGNNLDMFNVMRRYFGTLSDLNSLAFGFPETLYPRELVPDWIQQERPLLLDPVNPWRNPFHGIAKHTLKEIEQQAQHALKVLDKGSAKMGELFNVQPQGVRGA